MKQTHRALLGIGLFAGVITGIAVACYLRNGRSLESNIACKQRRLQKAIERQRFELAATLRDEIRLLEQEQEKNTEESV